MGNAHQTSEPSSDWPTASGRMFRSHKNNHAIAVLATNVKGRSTGFGQCKALKIAPASKPASQRRLRRETRRFVKRELRAICCTRQKRKEVHSRPNER